MWPVLTDLLLTNTDTSCCKIDPDLYNDNLVPLGKMIVHNHLIVFKC